MMKAEEAQDDEKRRKPRRMKAEEAQDEDIYHFNIKNSNFENV